MSWLADRGSKLADLRVELAQARKGFDMLQDTQPRTAGFFVRLMMGKVNVKMWKKSEKVSTRTDRVDHARPAAAVLMP